MKPELLLSVDSERRFWLDPRTKLYMLVIFSIVMIDGKTDGISFWSLQFLKKQNLLEMLCE